MSWSSGQPNVVGDVGDVLRTTVGIVGVAEGIVIVGKRLSHKKSIRVSSKITVVVGGVVVVVRSPLGSVPVVGWNGFQVGH
jgi:hypothetical protein